MCALTSRQLLDPCLHSFFFFNDTATTEIYTLSLHDALPISREILATARSQRESAGAARNVAPQRNFVVLDGTLRRSEEHTSELQSQSNIVCRLLLEKKKKTDEPFTNIHVTRSLTVQTSAQSC